MKAVIFGAGGQVGRALHLARRAPAADPRVALHCEAFSRAQADLEKPDEVLRVLNGASPSIVINAAAYTAVDRAESEPDRARATNAHAPARIAEWCAANGALLVHYSTDYVFRGDGEGPWRETDPTGPLSVYGRTKLEGEEAIRAAGPAHLILRTSWVYAPDGHNFVRTMLRLGRQRRELSVVDDQTGTPTLAEDLARATWKAVEAWAAAAPERRRDLEGTYHLCGGGEPTTWRRFAERIFAVAAERGFALAVESVQPVSTAAFGAPAPRPLNSRLNCDKFKRTFDFAMPPWEESLARTLEAIHADHPV